MYGIVQFVASEGGTVAVVVNKWLTPKKTEVYWPPTKDSKQFEKLLIKRSSPKQEWHLYGVERVFYETDHLEKAKKKLKLVEVTSDIQTEDESNTKRKVKRNCRYSSSDDDDNCDLPRPPPLKKALTSYLADDSEGRLTPAAPLREQSPNLSSDVPTTPLRGQGLTDISMQPYPPNVSTVNSDNLGAQNTSTLCLQDKVVSLLAHIKAQNDMILSILQEHNNTKPILKPNLKFPLKTVEELEKAEQLLNVEENYTNVVAYFRSLGGQGINNKVNRVMKTALCDSLACHYNFCGKRSDKKAFGGLRLRACIVESLKDSENKEKNIEDGIKSWLKHAPERQKKSVDKLTSQ